MRAKRRGFTLVELLIVVTIIGILLAFILKAYTGSIVAAEKSATISFGQALRPVPVQLPHPPLWMGATAAAPGSAPPASARAGHRC